MKHWISLLILVIFISILTACNRAERAEQELRDRNIPFTEESFTNAVISGNLEITRLFLDAGIDPSLEVDIRATKLGVPDIVYKFIPKIPILVAAELSHQEEITALLIKRGADEKRANKSRDDLQAAEEKFAEEITKQRDQIFPEFLR